MAIENEILRYQLSRAKEKIIEKTIQFAMIIIKIICYNVDINFVNNVQKKSKNAQIAFVK